MWQGSTAHQELIASLFGGWNQAGNKITQVEENLSGLVVGFWPKGKQV